MSLFFAELRKIWGGRVFPALLAILAAANLLLLWMGTRPTAKQPPASAYRAVGAELSDKTMEEKGAYLHNKYTEIESLVKIGQYYREQAYGGYGLTQYRQDNAAMFDAYEQEYNDKSYTLFTDDLNTEYRLFRQLSQIGRSSLSFELPLSFEQAAVYRKANGQYVRKNQWRDTTVRVFIDLD